VQIPDPKRHLVRYYGAYSNATRGKRKKAAVPAEPSPPHEAPEDAAIPDGPCPAALRRRWAELIRRVYEVDPLATGSLAPLRSRPSLWPPRLRSAPAPQSVSEERRTCRPVIRPQALRGLGRSLHSGARRQLAFPAAEELPPQAQPGLPRRSPQAVARGPREGSSYSSTSRRTWSSSRGRGSALREPGALKARIGVATSRSG